MTEEMSNEKVSVKIGTVSLELTYKGGQSFFENGLLEAARKFSELEINGVLQNIPLSVQRGDEKNNEQFTSTKDLAQLSTNEIATVLEKEKGGKKLVGKELVLAAMAKLHFVDGKHQFTRDEILSEMKLANLYFERNHRSNLTKMLISLQKEEKIRKPSEKSYGLKSTELNRLEQIFASAG